MSSELKSQLQELLDIIKMILIMPSICEKHRAELTKTEKFLEEQLESL